MDFRIQVAINLVKGNPRQQFSVTQLASLVNLSPSRFRSVFKHETGLGPVAYIRLVRMDLAKEFLENTSLTVEQIIIKIGAHDRSHFEREFKKAHGLTPTKYRTASRLAALAGDDPSVPPTRAKSAEMK